MNFITQFLCRDEALEKSLLLAEKSELKSKSKPSPKIQGDLKTYGLGAEARIRQMENTRNPIRIEPISEGRIRTQETRYDVISRKLIMRVFQLFL